MRYSYKEIPEADQNVTVFEDVVQAYEVCDLKKLPQYNILDGEGDHIATVHSETEAQVLVSHLNR